MATKVEGHLWQHAFESGLLASGAVLVLALVGPALGLHVWQLALAEGIAGFVTALCVLKATDSMPLAFFWFFTGVWAAGWTVLAHFMETWSKASLGVLGAGFVICTPWGMFLWSSYREELARHQNKTRAISAGLEHESWRKRFEEVELGGVLITKIEPTFAGRDIQLRLPMHGRISLSTLKAHVERIETACNMREGTIRFSKGPTRGTAIMHLAEKDVLSQDVPFPMDLMHRTINEPFPIGMLENGEYAQVLFREVAGLIVGVRGGGKSNLINVLIAQLAQCVDCVIWMIDLKGGRAAAPWLEPWVADNSGRTRPVLDWVATTPEEAEAMLDCFNAWIDLRSRNAGGKEKVVPSPKEPAIVLVVDEMAKVFGQGFGNKAGAGITNNQLANKAKAAVITGRSEAMDPVFATQRGTVTMTGDGDLKSQLQLRIGLGCTTSSDGGTVFPGDVQAQRRLVQLAKIPGAGVIEHDEELTPFKIFRIDPDAGDIKQVAEWCSRNTAAAPEEMLVKAGGEIYDERWSVRGQDLIEQVARRQLPEDEDLTFEEITRGLESESVNPIRTRVRDFVITAGTVGVSPARCRQLLEKAGYREDKDAPPDEKLPTRETIQRWLSADAGSGMFQVRSPGTPNVRYYLAPPRLVQDDDTGTEG
jgi:hypothetical protein